MPSNSNVAHAWANQTGRDRNGSHFYYRDSTIYSYGSHFPIARHTMDAEGRPVVLFTLRNYSPSTARHISITRRAASHLRLIFVYKPDAIGAGDVRANFEHFKRDAEAAAEKLIRARKPERYVAEINTARERAEAYAAFIGVQVPADVAEAFKITDADAARAYSEEAAEREERRRAAAAARALREHAEQVAEFRNFERAHVTNKATGRDFLRYNRGANRIETSQGVRIPYTAARRMFDWLIRTAAAGGCVGCDFEITGYRVREVTAETFTVGCHSFDISEARAIAAACGWPQDGEESAPRGAGEALGGVYRRLAGE